MNEISIAGRRIGPGAPTYVIAEVSANHGQNFDEAIRIIDAAKTAGADAVKLQTYTPDTITIDSDAEPFRIKGTIWNGRKLHELYREAYTPWEWQPKLMQHAAALGMHCFSSPFDDTAVDFLEGLNPPAYKIASFEMIDVPLIRRVAATGRPMIISTGMATLSEIEEAVDTARGAGATQIALLKCTSGYPAEPEEMNLRTIPHLAQAFGVVAGLSDHTLSPAIAIAAVTLGASIVEKHLTISRAAGGPDSAFSLEPEEFKTLVTQLRVTERALGRVHYGVSEREAASRVFRRSLFAVADIVPGESLTSNNIRSIRPGHGLHPRYLDQVLTRKAACAIPRGTPLQWNHLL
ncbi:MAG TPA: pseudaminic acid synthase [Chthoniobacter sp.]|jgi:N-acetylneuraminate synthase